MTTANINAAQQLARVGEDVPMAEREKLFQTRLKVMTPAPDFNEGAGPLLIGTVGTVKKPGLWNLKR